MLQLTVKKRGFRVKTLDSIFHVSTPQIRFFSAAC